ncbi:MAG: hypothetical protein KBA97_12305, partial [Methanothrix sp.]|nr:hypothetical protein [Methanothrix sp.]
MRPRSSLPDSRGRLLNQSGNCSSLSSWIGGSLRPCDRLAVCSCKRGAPLGRALLYAALAVLILCSLSA